ncbi:MAG TPA: RDD family protein [Bryobacteraceae bacterium]|jgi:uncharacterized RDD family membrane protein YckC|nr:RDD family protein [Bryobacteraceae bacterium]
MDWYYAAGGKQAGPVSDEALADLVRTGVIRAETLVWNSGLPGWVPYIQVAAPAPVTAAAAGPLAVGGSTFCTECGRPFSPNDLVRFGDRWVCGNCKETFAQKLREGVAPRGTMVYAGFWIRVGAMLIDQLILGAVAGVLIIAAILVLAPSLSRSGAAPEAALAAMSIGIGIGYLLLIGGSACYEAFFVSRSGATIGKKALGLKVVMPDGGPVSLGRAFGRFFAKMLSAIPLDLGFIMVGFDSEKRGLHDYICSTRVIRT